MEILQFERIKSLRTIEETIKRAYFLENDDNFPVHYMKDPKKAGYLVVLDYVNKSLTTDFLMDFIDELEFNICTDISNSCLGKLKEIASYLYSSVTDETEIEFNKELEQRVTMHMEKRTYSFLLGQIITDCDEELSGETLELKIDYLLLAYYGVTSLYKRLLEEVTKHIVNQKEKGQVTSINSNGESEQEKTEMADDLKNFTYKPFDWGPEELKSIRHKVVALDELGVIDFIRDKHFSLITDGNTSVSKLLYPIIGKLEDADNIRKTLEWIQTDDLRNNPRTKKTMENVMKVFNNAGIDPNR